MEAPKDGDMVWLRRRKGILFHNKVDPSRPLRVFIPGKLYPFIYSTDRGMYLGNNELGSECGIHPKYMYDIIYGNVIAEWEELGSD